jgi:predicted nucleotidyltransferase
MKHEKLDYQKIKQILFEYKREKESPQSDIDVFIFVKHVIEGTGKVTIRSKLASLRDKDDTLIPNQYTTSHKKIDMSLQRVQTYIEKTYENSKE